MKKLLVLMATLILVTGFAFAEDIGLTAGLEFGIADVASDDRAPSLTAMVSYENAFFDGFLDLYTELDYTIGFKKIGDSLPMDLYWDLALGYNFHFGKISNLSILLENELTFVFTPDSESGLSGTFTPGLFYTHDLKIGEVYSKVIFPMDYEKDKELGIGFDMSLGWNSYFGLGFKVVGCHSIKPDFAFTEIGIVLSYSADSFYVEVETVIPKSVGDKGVRLTPWFEYYFNAFTFYVYSEFDGVGSDSLAITPALGVKFSF